MSISTVFWQTFIFFIFIFIGNWSIRKGIVTPQGNKSISALIVNVFNPAMIIGSLMKRSDYTSRDLVLKVFIIALCVYAFYIIFAELTNRFFSKNMDERKMYRLMVVFSNVGYFGVPMINAIYGANALIYVTIFVFIFNVLVYTYGISVLRSGKSDGPKFELKNFINVGTLASLAALIIFLFDIRFPELFERNVISLGDVTTPLAMMSIGFLLGTASLKDIFLQKRLLILTLLKMLVFPTIAVFLLKMTGLPLQVIGTCALMVAMPNGNLPVVLANQYGLDAVLGSEGVIMSTLVSIVTLPLVAMML
ncbi:MAG: hypothetical protein GX933_09795 [Chloroflexi bacterium]|nr:hypothetical protein [Chloroflexota bacterium]